MTSPHNALVQSQVESLSKMGSVQLREELAKSFKTTVEQIVRMAAIIRVLEDRGEDLSDLKYSILGHLRRVAYGQVIPDVLVKFQGAPFLLGRVVGLPIPDQRRVLEDKPLRVVILGNGKTDHRLCEPLKMSASEVKQVFATDHIRDEGEQVSYLRGRPLRTHGIVQPGVSVDARRRGIIVTGEKVFISRSELISFLARVTD